jgi:hypothetical protein
MPDDTVRARWTGSGEDKNLSHVSKVEAVTIVSSFANPSPPSLLPQYMTLFVVDCCKWKTSITTTLNSWSSSRRSVVVGVTTTS